MLVGWPASLAYNLCPVLRFQGHGIGGVILDSHVCAKSADLKHTRPQIEIEKGIDFPA